MGPAWSRNDAAGGRQPLDGRYIALDLEYDVTPGHDHIWLVRAAIIRPAARTIIPGGLTRPSGAATPWSASPELLDQQQGLRVVIWADGAADIPGSAQHPPGTTCLAWQAAITGRHFDAGLWAHHSLRLPTLTLGVKEVSGYLGVRPCTDVADGLDRPAEPWLASKDETIRAQLTAYNRDDIDSLAHTVSRIRDLTSQEGRLQAEVVIDLDQSSWPEPLAGDADGYPAAVFQFLLRQAILRPVLPVDCPYCTSSIAFRPEDLATQMKCEMCLREFPLGLALGMNANDPRPPSPLRRRAASTSAALSRRRDLTV